MAFLILEKAFNQIPQKVISRAMRTFGIEEWIEKLVQGMNENLQNCVRVGEGLSDEFEVKVGEHQGSVLSQLLFIIVLDALSWEMGKFQLTGSRASLSALTRKRVMFWTKATKEDWKAPWPSGRASDSGARGRGFDPHSSRRVVSLSKIYLPRKKYPGSNSSVPT